MTNTVNVRQPLADWRWWAGFAALVVVAFLGGWGLFRLGFDSGAAGLIASAPLLVFAMLTIVWRRRALSSVPRRRSS
ncbi:hypothetical protein [Microbacterium memoriense]|uniref:DUF4175 domain-containing protein n=1 Tax=Microbacterium memoriense TaxID=2978350 RepID=A0ABT2PCQ2_9MICO|nr:hypothetical protein [Microbacterium memoriense]MCT9002358.1 hypothetical protein [Microbacterium memoriense]